MKTWIALGLLLLLSVAGSVRAAETAPHPAEARGANAARAANLPPDSAYVRVDKAGHLAVDGQRVRFWGAIGSLPPAPKTINGDPYYVARETVRRMKKVGFNMVRDWNLQSDDAAKKSDLSPTDYHDFFVAECGRQGVHLWVPSILGSALSESEIGASAALVKDAATAEDWKQAAKTLMGNGKETWLGGIAVAWDARLERVALNKARQKALHVNLHNGLRLADNPTCAIWELTNEQWWMTHMMGGEWQGLPLYFKKELLARWSDFLKRKYGTQESLTKAWGFLFPGEDLNRGTILLAPMANAKKAVELNDTNPAAIAAFKGMETPIGREQCTAARTHDVIECLLDILVAHKTRCAAELKTWGKSCRLGPTVLDTGIGQSIQAQYMQMQGDAVAHDSYMEGMQTGKFPVSHKRWPFYSGLDTPPQLSNDVPWLEHNRPAGKPYFVYETQFGAPSKYRAEWPMRIAAAGIIQEWDAVCWHYWGFDAYDLSKATPYTGGSLAFPGSGAYQYHFTYDAVEQATLRAASAILCHSLAAPASKPTLFSYGRSALYDPRSMDYGGDYGGPMALMDMMSTAYTYGMRLAIDPTQTEFLKTEGPIARFNGYEKACPLKASPEVAFDYNKSQLLFDAPGVASYTGFFSQYGQETLAFHNGVEVRDIKHFSEAAMPFPDNGERYTSFTLTSEDGRPLATCRKAVLVLVSSDQNTGLKIAPKMDGSKVDDSLDIDWGRAPILFTRVSATVTARALVGMRYRMLDFNEKVLSEGIVGADGVVRVPADRPVWLTELTRDH